LIVSDLVKLESLPVETLAEMANEAAAACEASGRKTVEHAATCGRALLAAKSQLPHGQWMDWLTQNFHHSDRLARQYMEIANWQRDANLEDATSVRGALRLISDTPEKQAKKAEREAKKPEAPQKAPASPAPAPTTSAPIIHHKAAPTPQPQLERSAWLADPDELDRPEEDDLPPLPKTNTHHTTENRRQPDAQEMGRIGIVPPDDPRTLQDGAWYQWSEAANRLLPITDDDILAEAERLNGE